mgnify:CR=1 FL=1
MITPIFDEGKIIGYVDQNNVPLEPFYAVRITKIVTDSGEVIDFNLSFFDYITNLNFLNDFANIWVNDNFAELLTFFCFFGLIVIVIHAVIAELTWITQLFNAKTAPVFKKTIKKNTTYNLSSVNEDTFSLVFFKGLFLSYFY